MGSAPSKRQGAGTKPNVSDKSNAADLTTKGQEDLVFTVICKEENSTQRLQNLFLKLEEAPFWATNYDSVWEPRFLESVKGLFHEVNLEISRLSAERDLKTVDKIVASVLGLRSTWDDEVFQTLKLKSFPRERIKVDNYTVHTGQYFQPEPFYNNNDKRLSKVYFFEVKDKQTKSVVFTYYLECSNLLQKLYILGLLLPSGQHLQVYRYGHTCPCYWRTREDSLNDLRSRKLEVLD